MFVATFDDMCPCLHNNKATQFIKETFNDGMAYFTSTLFCPVSAYLHNSIILFTEIIC